MLRVLFKFVQNEIKFAWVVSTLEIKTISAKKGMVRNLIGYH